MGFVFLVMEKADRFVYVRQKQAITSYITPVMMTSLSRDYRAPARYRRDRSSVP